jgi:hypothetical protein
MIKTLTVPRSRDPKLPLLAAQTDASDETCCPSKNENKRLSKQAAKERIPNSGPL